MPTTQMDTIVSLCKRRGFIFPGSEIYGGLANTWDYGPYGVELKNNIKRHWWKTFVQQREDMVGLDSGILMNPRIWEASGHVTSFSDPLIDCKKCKERFRGDKLIEEKNNGVFAEIVNNHLEPWEKGEKKSESAFSKETALALIKLKKENQTKMFLASLPDLLKFYEIKCPACGSDKFTEARSFNLMFKTFQGVTEDTQTEIFLRPETAQGIFVNFKNAQGTTRKKLPFGIGQIGKAFRNEITPGNFTFRTREFEQMEIEYFIKPNDSKKYFDYWCEESMKWFLDLGIKKENLRFREHTKEELSHYSSMTKDIEYNFPFGWGELEGIADRGNFDLTQHIKFSGEDLSYLDPATNEKIVPHVIEPSFGADRTVLTFLINGYHEEEAPTSDGKTEKRVVMKFHKILAPIKVAILPLSNKLNDEAYKVFQQTIKEFRSEFDTSGSIGKRYRRQDEIGTPYCVTFDFESLNDKSVTVRDRDTMKQERVKIEELNGWMAGKFKV